MSRKPTYEELEARIRELERAFADSRRENEEKYRLIFQNAPLGFLHFNQEGVITACNDMFVQIIGSSKKALIGLNMLHLRDEKFVHAVREALNNRQGYYKGDYRSVTAEKVTPIRVHFSPYRFRDNDVCGGVGIVEDITERKKAEQILLESEERYRLLVEDSNDIVWTFDIADMVFTYCSRSVTRILGYNQEEAMGSKLDLLFAPEEREEVLSVFRKLIRDENSPDRVMLEAPHRSRNGQAIWMEINAVMRRNENGEPVSFSGVSRDITARKNAEAALQESEEKYRSLFENAPAGIFRTDSKGGVALCNTAMARILGFDAVEGALAYYSNLGEQLYADPERRREFIRLLQKNGSVKNFEYEAKLPGGEKKWLNMDARITASRKGGAFLIEGFATDITERKQAEQALQKSEARFRELSEMLPETVFETNGEIRLTFVNRQAYKMFGYTEEDFKNGLNGLDMISPEDRPKAVENILAKFAGKSVGVNEYTAIRKDGSTFPVLFHTSPIFANDQPAGLRGVIVDMTERRRIERQLQKTQKIESIGTLAGGIAHDFNNLLFPILGMSELLLEDLPKDGSEWQCVREIFKASKRGSELVKQILAFSRKAEPKKQPSLLQQVLKEAVNLSRSTIPADIEITSDILPDCGVVMADPTQMHQVVMNLITNAYHAVQDQGGSIFVSLRECRLEKEDLTDHNLPPGRFALISIADNGVGVDPAIMDRIFEPYFTTKGTGKGTGLGLAVVHGIIKDHRGEIKIKSKPGKGTVVDIFLPLMKKSEEQALAAPGERIPSGNERIMLVDDEEPVVNTVGKMLNRLGYEVCCFTNSLDALDHFRHNSSEIDLVMTDMTMPHMTGDLLIKEISAIRPDIPAVICTGFNEKIDEKVAKAIGIEGYLLKPVLRKDLAEMLRSILDQEK
ncbi:PAS domain S-box-containing protein [Desulfatibacillum alkenivorans DSM 16219]|jgi:PAS domain S-box-containing protein|uniref:histidine kinase n=1 Tax=Desulfatibacillum alkenivorans DSM 16219 TaxID=1121393 RepID=A0A1M6UWB2_9BACT|nr:PAS domain S-box protein [Desulfatibacillum alkenivorans]SHK73547.1 PAS domain S-box-containing protein [Desulfatibacillum alkenivorans DSM 16219]